MNGWRYKLYQFMQGRRGVDQFSRALMYTAMILLIVSMFTFDLSAFFYYPGIILFAYSYYRVFSKNLYQREIENQKFLSWKYRVTKGKSFAQWRSERKYYAYFKCPGCGQKMRAPKGKGNIKVKCHNCSSEFTKRV